MGYVRTWLFGFKKSVQANRDEQGCITPKETLKGDTFHVSYVFIEKEIIIKNVVHGRTYDIADFVFLTYGLPL